MLAGLEEASGIVSGENIGQVASQTLENLLLIDCLRMPVYRPLVAMDKEEIIDAARKIGTYELAKKGVKCRFVPEKPSTRAGEDVILEIEKEIGIERLLEDVRSCFVFGK
jgi:thiamine biosynthesis protein ThiI